MEAKIRNYERFVRQICTIDNDKIESSVLDGAPLALYTTPEFAEELKRVLSLPGACLRNCWKYGHSRYDCWTKRPGLVYDLEEDAELEHICMYYGKSKG